MITRDQAVMCAEFMLDEDPWEMVLPYPVASALAYYDGRRSMHSIMVLADALSDWLVVDRTACIALLGPGLGLEP